MKIHIVFPGALYPIVGMSQVRMVNQLKCLARDHEVVFSDIVSRSSSVDLAKRNLAGLAIVYEPVYLPSFNRSFPVRALNHLSRLVRHFLTSFSREEVSLGASSLKRQILHIFNNTGSEALLIHYWYLGNVFNALNKKAKLMIDTHYVVEENIELLQKYSASAYKRWRLKRELAHCLLMQRKYFNKADLVIVNSSRQKELIQSWNKRVPVSVVINGQDLEPFLSYRADSEPEKAVCFYGSLSNQFNRKALSRVLNEIFPMIKKAVPACRLYVIGSNPPADILAGLDESVIVTGFVDDIRPYLTKCYAMLLPLETGSGFRGRIVEVMALGIPVVGTSNGLQSVGFLHEQHGYVEESDEALASRTISLLNNDELRHRMGGNCREFASSNFSLEDTFGRLSREITGIGAAISGEGRQSS
jgi:glycosyltransferase involved in cell wall biosynthesis